MKKVFIGVAWPYVNGDLHIGHLAGYLLPADIFARYNRLVGNQVLMVSGSDCFGTPITIEADKRGVHPSKIVEEYHTKDVDLFKNILGLTYDLYTLTNHENHIKITQDFFIKFLEADLLFIDTQKQYYSSIANRFLPDRYVIGECPFCHFKESRSDQCDNCGRLITQGELINPVSNLSKEPVELKDTQHYFIDWPKLQKTLRAYVDSTSSKWKGWVAKETYGWLEEGLKPRAITRDLDWGVEIPVDRMPADKIVDHVDSKRIYVWFDAVIGYLSASILWSKENQKDWKNFWHGDKLKHYYFMGKDNLVFHTLFWPAQIMTYDKKLHLPDVVSINMFLNHEGKQFSKSRGTSISIKDIVETYGNDAVRFYLTLIMPETKDSCFSWSDFSEKINGVLVATLGNFIHRVLSMTKEMEFDSTLKVDDYIVKGVEDAYHKSKIYLNKCEFRNYLNEILALASFGNNVVDKQRIWELKKNDPKKFRTVMTELVVIILALRDVMNPLMPHATDRLDGYLGLEGKTKAWPENGKEMKHLKSLLADIAVGDTLKPLFTKIELIKT